WSYRDMNRCLIAQTESELRMHRILYLLKYLRAMILNSILVIVSVVLYIFVGVSGIYPVAEDSVNALRAQMTQYQQRGSPFGGNFHVIIMFFTFIFLPCLFVWIYLSITNVWRKSLKAQTIVCIASILFAPVFMWPYLTFSTQNFDPLFTALLAIYFAL